MRIAPLLLVLVGCVALPRPQLSAVAHTQALDDAAEQFYRAQTVTELRSAADAAARIAPDAALTHELGAALARLEGREFDTTTHLLAALRDTNDDAALLHLHTLMTADFTFAQRPTVRAHLEVLAHDSPSEDVRALARHHLASMLNQEGRLEERTATLAGIDGVIDLALVGTWDNDQGKAFDYEYAPEVRPELTEQYEGRSGPLKWRPHAMLDPRGRIDLAALMTPPRWSVAYAQGQLVAAEEGPYTLHLMSTDPLKVWVDGKLVFAAPQLDRAVYDNLALHLTLKQGSHRLVVKSAHRDADWYLVARLTKGHDGTPLPSLDAVLTWRVANLAPGPRRLAHLVSWAHLTAGGTFTVRLADAWVREMPKSIAARTWLTDALWYNQERGRTADSLQALDAELGDALPLVRLRQTRFHQQQGLKQQARTRLLQLVTDHPDVREAYDQLADFYRAEGWTEDELRVMAELHRRFGRSAESASEEARGLLRFGKRAAALQEYEEVLDELPTYGIALRRVAELAVDSGQLEKAAHAFERRLESWPTDFLAWTQLAEVRRRSGDVAGAMAALDQATALSPESAGPYLARGDLAYEAKDQARALVQWRRALELNPENDSLANRIDFLAPEARGPWMADIPDEAALERAVKLRGALAQTPGADLAWLLDHEVTLLNSDGSTSNVVTHVVHTWNAQGRDRIMRQTVGQAGRLRVLHAFSVDERGVRSEASSERNRQIFFRGMQPGSTLVLQYRLDAPPKGYLSRYYTESWTFQGVGEQRVEATFVLWTPLGTTLHEEKVGEVERAQDRRGDQLRIIWSAKQTAPLVAEPGMPTVQELAANIRISTVPDWKTWLSWEQALLEGVFRDSPEVDALVKQLGEGAGSEEEKLKRVHQYVMEEIRYQQDYESFIAGVKPHPAPVVLERRYGDCKDKAVLFIELARKLGLQAHFALVRTRDAGPASADVPMQQFNHAIVYIPAQQGVPTGRFFDPTAELLDLDTVRHDDVGTRSLVYDPTSGDHTWREIPLQAPEANRERTLLTLQLEKDGSARGGLRLEGVGRTGSTLRRTTRNADVLAQASQRVATLLIPNATATQPKAVEAKSLREPAVVTMNIEARTLARPEGDALRLKVPTEFNPRSYFTLATRRHPLVLGAPSLEQDDFELSLPEGFEVRKLPHSGKVDLPCLSLEREVHAEGRVVKSTQAFRITCERISAAEYLTYRGRVDEMVRLLEDELVLGPSAPTGKKVAPTPKR